MPTCPGLFTPSLRHAIAGLLVFVATAAGAQPVATREAANVNGAVQVVLTQAKVVSDSQGREKLVAADSIKPGDVLEYRATYVNHGGKAVNGLVANLPIPEGLEYLRKSASPGASLVTAATRDGKYAPEPLVRLTHGKPEPVPYSEYRALRWTLGQLPAKGQMAVTARVRVETGSTTVAAVSTQ